MKLWHSKMNVFIDICRTGQSWMMWEILKDELCLGEYCTINFFFMRKVSALLIAIPFTHVQLKQVSLKENWNMFKTYWPATNYLNHRIGTLIHCTSRFPSFFLFFFSKSKKVRAHFSDIAYCSNLILLFYFLMHQQDRQHRHRTGGGGE